MPAEESALNAEDGRFFPYEGVNFMKKSFLRILAAALGAVFITACSCEGGCAGCAPVNHLAFTANWTADKASHSATFKETSVYKVERLTDYKRETAEKVTDDFTAQENEAFSAKFGEGSYIVTVQAIPFLPADLGISVEETELYKIETAFSIPVTYTVTATEKSYTFEDTISSVAYFRAHNVSLSPIYSHKTYDSVSVGGSADDVKVLRYAYSTTINWMYEDGVALLTKENTDTSELAHHAEYAEDAAYSVRQTDTDPSEIKYTSGTVLDNETLFFAIRGLSPKIDSFSSSVKIIDTAYNSVQSVAIASSRSYNYTGAWTLDRAGTVTEFENKAVPTALTTVRRGDTTYSGTAKHCYYQLASDDSGAPYRAFLMQFVDKLPNGLGALQYSLTSVTVSE